MSLMILSVLLVLSLSSSKIANAEQSSNESSCTTRLEQLEKRMHYMENIMSKVSAEKLEKAKEEKFETMDQWTGSNISRRYTDLHKRGISVNSICSFYVSLSHDLHLHTGVPVVFDYIRLNENNCYNSGDGVFVASMDGIYIFHWKITTHSGGKAGVHINKNGLSAGIVLYVKSYDEVSSRAGIVNHNSVADFAILRLQRGDHVNIASSSENSFIHAGHSGFGGFYLRG